MTNKEKLNVKEIIPISSPGEDKEIVRYTKFSLHAVSQFYGNNKQLSLFSDEKIEEFSQATGINIEEKLDSYGAVLNQAQMRVYEGIARAFTDTNYRGDEQIDKTASLRDVYKFNNKVEETLIAGSNAPYKNIDKIPVLRLTQAEIIRLSGYDLKRQRQGDKQDVIEALYFLGTKQFCFYWKRLKTVNGKPVKDKNGDFIKEEVMEVGSIFRIKTVRNESGELQYYEIHPSAPIIDQIDNYFLLIPVDWREDVKRLTGIKASRYTYEFLTYLREQFEQIRRYNSKRKNKKQFILKRSWEDIAVTLKMPESVYKANRKTAIKLIQNSYDIAIKLGYLLKVENNGAVDVLYLNEDYYPQPGELV